MRRSDREIKDQEAILQVIKKCDVCRLALNDDGYPYILPLNFGMQIEDGKVVFYFHGALEGRKYELIAKDNRASFEMDCSHRLVSMEDKGYCTMEYESVIGRGRIEILPEEKKYDALRVLVEQYHKDGFDFSPKAIPRTAVMRMEVTEMTAKARMKKA